MKAKLVIDMPDNCWECIFRRQTISGIGFVCVAKQKLLPKSYCNASKRKPKWCPLEPIKEGKYAIDSWNEY